MNQLEKKLNNLLKLRDIFEIYWDHNNRIITSGKWAIKFNKSIELPRSILWKKQKISLDAWSKKYYANGKIEDLNSDLLNIWTSADGVNIFIKPDTNNENLILELTPRGVELIRIGSVTFPLQHVKRILDIENIPLDQCVGSIDRTLLGPLIIRTDNLSALIMPYPIRR